MFWKSKKYYKQYYSYHKEMHEHYKEILKTALSELKFTRLQVEHLICVVDEVQEINTNKLVERILTNWIERWELDKDIHNKLVWEQLTNS
jgi:hypothetical protein